MVGILMKELFCTAKKVKVGIIDDMSKIIASVYSLLDLQFV